MLQVLLVDDDVHMLDILKSRINWSKYHYQILGTANNGEEALEMIGQTMPDLIITDVKMPVMDGLDLCKQVQRLRGDIPIILLSAYEDMYTARLAMKYNVTEYLLKPLNLQNMHLLENILEELSNNHIQQLFYQSISRDAHRKKEIGNYLLQKDTMWFHSFFQQFADCISSRFQVIYDACLSMISILYGTQPDTGLELEKARLLTQCATKLEMVSFISELYEQALHGDNIQTDKIDYQSHIFQQIYQYTLENYMMPDFNASILSERFHFSADHIGRLFGRHMGITLNQYVTQKRLELAMSLLSDFDITINEVAEKSGFRNQNYFSRVFRKYKNTSPTEYRMQLLIQSGNP